MSPRFCYVVLCHQDAPAVIRLLRRIRALSPEAGLVVRHDRPGLLTQDDVAGIDAVVLESPREAVWGAWSLVEAMCEGLETARSQLPSDYYVIISGQDYPVRNLLDWEEEVRRAEVDGLILRDDPPPWRVCGYRWLPPFSAPTWVPSTVDSGLARLGTLVNPRIPGVAQFVRKDVDLRWRIGYRRLPWGRLATPPVPVVKGSAWMTLSAEAVDIALDAVQDPRHRRYFASCVAPDELFFQSVCSAAPELRLADSATSHFRFPPGSSSPAWLTQEDLVRAVRQGVPFARKVAPGDDAIRDSADRLVGPAASPRGGIG